MRDLRSVTTSAGRIDALVKLGAHVVRHSGNYDEAVLRAEADAKANGWFIISDTAYEGHEDTPRDVMHGYRVIVDEVVQQLSSGQLPTHVFIQTGIGGIAAAFATHFWRYGTSPARALSWSSRRRPHACCEARRLTALSTWRGRSIPGFMASPRGDLRRWHGMFFESPAMTS